MFKHIITGLLAICFLSAASYRENPSASQHSANLQTASFNTGGTMYTPINTDDISYELKYLYDKTGKKFAAEICLKNNTDKNFRVTWTLKGSVNINLPADTGTKDLPAFTKVCIMTVFPVDPAKEWDPGVFHFDWEVID